MSSWFFVILVVEFEYFDEIQPYILYIEILDRFVVALFVSDLLLKYRRVKSTGVFFEGYWLDIITTVPFFLFFSLLEGFSLLFRLGGLLVKESTRITCFTKILRHMLRTHYR